MAKMMEAKGFLVLFVKVLALHEIQVTEKIKVMARDSTGSKK